MTRRTWMPVAALAAMSVLSIVWIARAQSPATTAPAGAAAAAQLVALKPILSDANGRWDDLTVDSEGQRVYVAAATHVLVFDTAADKYLGEVADTPGNHGVALVPELNLGFVTCGRDNMVVSFDLKTLKIGKKVKAGKNPDGIIYDPASKRVYAFNHSGGDITIIDPSALDKEPNTLVIGGTLEFGVADGAGHVYVNVEDKNETVAIDSKAEKVTARWPLAPGEGPSGLAIDVAHRRLFAGCGGNKKMVVLDADTGKVLASLDAGAGIDGAAFDPGTGLAVTSNGRDGTLTVVREGPAGQFAVVQTVKTAVGARTVKCDPKTHRFYLPCNIPGAGGAASKFGLCVVGLADASAAPATKPDAVMGK